MLTCEQLNEKISEIEDSDDFFVEALGDKNFPYIGWFWRTVDFDERISLGRCPGFVGFMESNKWGYPEWEVTEEQDAEIKRRLQDICAEPTSEKLNALYDYIQTCDNPEAKGYGLW